MMDAVRFGRNDHLLGIVHSPQGQNQNCGVVLWNTGISHRTGPYGINTEIAKAMAGLGFTVLRFDLSQLGDSGSPQGQQDLLQRCNDDLKDALDVLQQRYEIDQAVLIGLCSSAVDAYYFARIDARVKGLVMVDGFVYPTLRHKVTSILLRARDFYRWRRMFQLKILRRTEEPIPLDFFESHYPEPRTAAEDINTLVARGVKILVVYTGGFSPFFTYDKQYYAMLPGLRQTDAIRIQRWSAIDHLFMLIEDREYCVKQLSAWAQDFIASSPFFLPAAKAPKLGTLAAPIAESTTADLETSSARSEETAKCAKALDEDERYRMEETIIAIYRDLLLSPSLQPNDNFFECGGTSILALKALTAINQQLGIDLPVIAIHRYAKAQDLVNALIKNEFVSAVQSHAAFRDAQDRTLEAASESSGAIAIIGMACHVPGAKTVDEFWDIVREGRDAITRFAPHDLDPSLPRELTQHKNYVPYRGVIDAERFDHDFFKMARKEALLLDPQQRILIETAWQALEDSGYSVQRSKHRIAVYAGVGSSSYLSRNLAQGHIEPHSEEEYVALLVNDKDYVATRISYLLNLKGPSISVHTACSTSLVAVIEAIKCLQAGQADLAIAGAAAVNAPIASGHLYQEGGIFSSDGSCRPFDAKASGTLFSDGSAVVVLKTLERALSDGDTIHAVIRGWGINNDGAEKSSFAAPSVDGQADAVRAALQKAGIDPRSIGYVECHGTATPMGDPIEIEGLKRAYQSWTPDLGFCAIGSVKANIGHLTAAAGGIGLIKAALCVKEGLIPALTHFSQAHPFLRLEQTPFFVPDRARSWLEPGPRRAAVSAFGVGGTNAHLIIEQAPQKTSHFEPFGPSAWTVLPIHAKSQKALDRLASSYQKIFASEPGSSPKIRDGSYTQLRERDVLDFAQYLIWHPESTVAVSSAVYKTSRPRIALLFPGQGSQYLQMGLELSRSWPAFAQTYQNVRALFTSKHGLDLESALQDDSSKLSSTLYTQPLLFAMEYALAQSLIDQGLEVAALIGHSLGEITAACLSGVLTLEDAVTLVFHRSRLMQSAAPGFMLSVRAPWSLIEGIIGTEVELAAENTEQSLVLTGPESSFTELTEALSNAGVAFKRLPGSHAFHSSLMAGVLPEFAQIAKSIRFSAPRIAIYSTVTGSLLSAPEAQSSDYWVQQIRQPVRFAKALAAAENIGTVAFMEIGPKDTLTRFAQQLHVDSSRVFACLPARGQMESRDFSEALARLWSWGQTLFAITEGQRQHMPVYPFHGEKLWLHPKMLSATPVARVGKEQLVKPKSSPQEPTMKLRLELRDVLAALLSMETEQLTWNEEWSKLGLDSLLLTQWALKIQKHYGIDMNVQMLQHKILHLNALADFIHEQHPHLHQLAPDESGLSAAAEASVLAVQAALDPAVPYEMAALIREQLEVMKQQLSLLEVWQRTAPISLGPLHEHESPEPHAFLQRLKHVPSEGTLRFFNDRGSHDMTKAQNAFLALDDAGQAALFIEDGDHPGSFWKFVEE